MAKPGRPTKMTDATVKKLDEAFAFGLTDAEASLYAGISKQTLYNYCEVNPEYVDRKETLKNSPKMIAKINIAKKIKKGDVYTSQWYLERKDDDFSNKQKVQHSGTINNPYEGLSTEELKEFINKNDG